MNGLLKNKEQFLGLLNKLQAQMSKKSSADFPVMIMFCGFILLRRLNRSKNIVFSE